MIWIVAHWWVFVVSSLVGILGCILCFLWFLHAIQEDKGLFCVIISLVGLISFIVAFFVSNIGLIFAIVGIIIDYAKR